MRVIVTGASRGIGRGIATLLAREGFSVGLLARSGEALEEVQRAIESFGGTAARVPCDLRDPRATEVAFSTLLQRLGGVDALINNAGLIIRKDIFTLSLEEWRAMVETNVSGLFHATRTVLPHMKAQASGHIINISSISGRLPLAGGSAYAATKHAVTGFSESLFLEVRDYGIKVTTIFPGSVETRGLVAASGDESRIYPEDVGRACLDVLRASSPCLISSLEIRSLKRPPGTAP